MGLKIVATGFKLGWQRLRVLLSILELHLEEVQHVVSQLNHEVQDLFLTRTEQRGISRVKCQL